MVDSNAKKALEYIKMAQSHPESVEKMMRLIKPCSLTGLVWM